jgi:hypothetical protein
VEDLAHEDRKDTLGPFEEDRMPESPLETHELKEQLEEAVEHGHGGHGHGEGGASWIMYLSLTTAVIAVIAAIAALYAGGYANEAIVVKNDAVLKKASSSDKYSEYESRKIKSHIYTAQADSLPPEKAELAEKFRAIVKRELDEAKKPLAEAEKLKAESEEQDRESEALLHKHEILARAVTVFQVAIALSAIAALTKRKMMWLFSMGVGILGIGFCVKGSMPHQPHDAPGGEHEKPAASAEHPGGGEGKPSEKKGE